VTEFTNGTSLPVAGQPDGPAMPIGVPSDVPRKAELTLSRHKGNTLLTWRRVPFVFSPLDNKIPAASPCFSLRAIRPLWRV
jgi:hypothetical protein